MPAVGAVAAVPAVGAVAAVPAVGAVAAVPAVGAVAAVPAVGAVAAVPAVGAVAAVPAIFAVSGAVAFTSAVSATKPILCAFCKLLSFSAAFALPVFRVKAINNAAVVRANLYFFILFFPL